MPLHKLLSSTPSINIKITYSPLATKHLACSMAAKFHLNVARHTPHNFVVSGLGTRPIRVGAVARLHSGVLKEGLFKELARARFLPSSFCGGLNSKPASQISTKIHNKVELKSLILGMALPSAVKPFSVNGETPQSLPTGLNRSQPILHVKGPDKALGPVSFFILLKILPF